ncbi:MULTISPECIES: ATP-binding protein [Streptomyces]|uniref:Uncharacterized protein n=2 Tax=Streptomyces TaxID=1883 RepID=A0A100Y9M8_9ACTN|nr:MULTISPECIES: ATP-binding protein [Streptomyces]KUH40198.1 hypothetical protein ATE80_02510 [Streptomyces kanasensis]UUS34180.1 NB-ARC domain-containing protein [Streptomyces changanensis]
MSEERGRGRRDGHAHDEVRNEISGGVFLGPVVQGRDVTVQLPRPVPVALSGLPPASGTFTGREAELTALLRELAPGVRQQAVLVSAVAGLGGVGKTELVVQTAKRAMDEEGWFPGGVLFIDMLGYDAESPLTPEHALDHLLRALGTPPERIPPDLQGRSLLYRSTLSALAAAGRRVLVVVDNASSEDQVRPLLPSDGATATLVTSRDNLDVGARLHDLAALDEAASVELLDRALRAARGPGDTRVADAPDHAAVTARLCGGLPLALRIIAALLADSPTRPLASLTTLLTEQHSRLDRLRRRDRSVRAAFDLSYRRLSPRHSRLLRLLPLNPGPDISTESAARLAGVALAEAEELLLDLADTHLVDPGPAWGRWRLHDLVRLYAAEQGLAHAVGDDRHAAQTRLHRHYVVSCWDARSRMFRPYRLFPRFSGASRFASPEDAEAWFAAERVNLVSVITADPPLGHPWTSTVLAWFLAVYLSWEHLGDDLRAITATVRNTADQPGGSSRAVRLALFDLGYEQRRMGLSNAAIHTLLHAAALARDAGERRTEARVLDEIRHALHKLDVRWATLTPAAHQAIEEYVFGHVTGLEPLHTDRADPWGCGCRACWERLLARARSQGRPPRRPG